MTKKQKKQLMVIAGIVVAIIIIWLLLRGKGTNIIQQNAGAPINVSIPGFNMPPRHLVDIPGLPEGSAYEFQAVSPCMCNGSQTVAPRSSGSGLTFVTNQGNSGPNIFNYYIDQTSSSPTGCLNNNWIIQNGRYVCAG